MKKKPTIFISHISEEAELAGLLKQHLQRDFLGLMDVFVSSDEVSIAPGSKFLDTILKAIESASFELILCSKASVTRPWINFEAGAGWLRKLPVVPVCHSGLSLAHLPMPLAVLHGITAGEPSGLRRLYITIAQALRCAVPEVSFEKFAEEVLAFEETYRSRLDAIVGGDDARMADAKKKMYRALGEKGFTARGLVRLAVKGGVTVGEARDILRSDPNIEFDWDKEIGVIVKLRPS